MLDGLFMLLALSMVMAIASFLAGALPLSMSLSPTQLRLISAIGVGVLVGTSLIVIIPEGIDAVYTASSAAHPNSKRYSTLLSRQLEVRWAEAAPPVDAFKAIRAAADAKVEITETPQIKEVTTPQASPEHSGETPKTETEHEGESAHGYIGLALILGFILMYLIDKLPRHASDTLQSAPAPRHISLDNLSGGLSRSGSGSPSDGDEESDSFLHSLAPTPKQSRSLATTTGLVIHAAADGIAMGASSSTSNQRLGFIIFIAIMVHKAPAAFGLTSVLLKQGLSKRAARGHLIIFSLAAPVGALTTWVIVNLVGGSSIDGEKGQWWTGTLLLFSAGTFLYVAMHSMQEDSTHDHSISNGYGNGDLTLNGGMGLQRKAAKPQMRDTFAAVAGMLIPLLTQIGHSH